MRMFLLLLALLCGGFCVSAAHAQDAACGPAIAAAERAQGTAAGLLAAIGTVESGRMDPRTGTRQPWPWTVTAEGVGTFYPGRRQAMDAVAALRGKGVFSIDVGCMQVNLLHHPAAFRTLEEAFEPGTNAAYAARFLFGLYGRLGTWPAAAAAYHSLNPERGARYGRLVAAVWAGAPLPTTAGPAGLQVVTFPDGGELRVIRDLVGPAPAAGAGRGAVGGAGRVLGYLSGP